MLLVDLVKNPVARFNNGAKVKWSFGLNRLCDICSPQILNDITWQLIF
jgi:hypothetical protein